ncbi:unnamed protein product, partial [Staurois parvus]
MVPLSTLNLSMKLGLHTSSQRQKWKAKESVFITRSAALPAGNKEDPKAGLYSGGSWGHALHGGAAHCLLWAGLPPSSGLHTGAVWGLHSVLPRWGSLGSHLAGQQSPPDSTGATWRPAWCSRTWRSPACCYWR